MQSEEATSGNEGECAPCESPAVIPVDLTIKVPKRILHFSDGVLEEYSDDEQQQQQVDENCGSTDVIDPQSLKWVPFLWYYMITFGSRTLNACDYMGEYLAYFFGITSPKYQYEIDEYMWLKKQEDAKKEEGCEMESWKTDDNEEKRAPVDTQPSTLQRY